MIEICSHVSVILKTIKRINFSFAKIANSLKKKKDCEMRPIQ